MCWPGNRPLACLPEACLGKLSAEIQTPMVAVFLPFRFRRLGMIDLAAEFLLQPNATPGGTMRYLSSGHCQIKGFLPVCKSSTLLVERVEPSAISAETI
jgi:hypothetical protein